ncbi:rCG23070, partial [Rattus norvegicus]
MLGRHCHWSLRHIHTHNKKEHKSASRLNLLLCGLGFVIVVCLLWLQYILGIIRSSVCAADPVLPRDRYF